MLVVYSVMKYSNLLSRSTTPLLCTVAVAGVDPGEEGGGAGAGVGEAVVGEDEENQKTKWHSWLPTLSELIASASLQFLLTSASYDS